MVRAYVNQQILDDHRGNLVAPWHLKLINTTESNTKSQTKIKESLNPKKERFADI